MMKNPLIKVSTTRHRGSRPGGSVEVIIERYADPRNPSLCKLWVVNGEKEFKRNRDSNAYCSRLFDQAGGTDWKDESPTRAQTLIKTYSEEFERRSGL